MRSASPANAVVAARTMAHPHISWANVARLPGHRQRRRDGFRMLCALCGAGSRRCTERLELRIGGEPFVDVSRAAARRQLEQAHRLVLRTLPQRQYAAVEIGFADLALLLVYV